MIRTEAVRRAIEAEIAIGVAKGIEQVRTEILDNMLLNSGLSVELIASYTKASLELVKQRSLIIRGK